MRTKFIHIFLLLLISIVIPAQSSIHHRDKLVYKKSDKSSISNEVTIESGTHSLTKSVFGFLPYWELNSAVIRLDLLSHIALFDFVLESNGSISFPPDWDSNLEKWNAIINEAKSNNVKVIMTISNLSLTNTDSLLVSNLINNQSAKINFFSDTRIIISSYNLDGINLDFENPKLSERGDPINNFVQELKDSLDIWFTGKELSFATPAVNWGNRWKLKELSEICDYLFIMAYDYHGSWSTNAGPVAPLTGNETYNLKNYETTITEDYVDINPAKLILGVPYYGSRWQIETEDPYSDVIPFSKENTNWDGNPNYKDINWSTFKNTFVLDDLSNSTYSLIHNNDKYDLTWIDTDYSLSLKYDFAIENNLKGIGFWSLGKDGNYPELWDLIENKFTDTTLAVEDNELMNDFVLYQNYPNPFNPTTTIKFTIPQDVRGETQDVKLIVYNVLGQKVKTLVNQKLQPGYHEVNFDASNISSGMYFYELTSGGFTQIKKMLLLK